MAEIAGGRKITELTEKTTLSDSDILIEGSSGTNAMRRFTLSSLATWIKSKIETFTFTFSGGSRTLQDELNSITQGAGTVNYIHYGATYITTSKKDISFILTTNRVVQQNVRIASAVPVACQIRQNNNYLYNKSSTDDLSDLRVTYTKRYNGIQITLRYYPNGATDSQEFPNAVNNETVGVYLSLDITYELQ